MSFVFSKNKEKRSRSSTGESNSSFVKNVTSRVTGLLPAGITKWFSSPSSSSANGSAAIADGTDSSTEDEAPDNPSMIQPPAKRIRYSSPVGKYSHLTTSETTTTSNIVTETGSVLYSSIQSPPGRHTIRRDSDLDRDPFTQHTVSAIGQSIAQKRKSLFDSDQQREQSLIACAKTAAHQVKDIKQPHFKPHLLGSPFYPGQTTYGGASASTSYMDLPNIKQRKMTYVNESSDTDSVNMSSSSRRVMDLLENYSSPLIEAKRIPRYELSELLAINKSKQPSTSTRHSYKTQELYVPSTATRIRMKARGRLMDSTKAARQIIASHSSTLSSFQPYAVDPLKTDRPDSDTGGAKSQSKLKSRLTRPNRGEDLFVLPETVELPTVVLQIDKNNLPKFTFEGPTSKPIEKSSKPIYETFKFSNPLPITAAKKITVPRTSAFDFGSPEKASVNTTPPKFSFEKQTGEEPIKTKPEPEKKVEPAMTDTTANTVMTLAKASNNWCCPDCWVSNKGDVEKCACCGAKQPTKQTATTATETTSKCTTCKLSSSQPNSDRCVNCEKLRANIKSTNSLPVTKKASSSKWKCGGCWVDNEEAAEKCVCCGSRSTQQGAPLANSQPAAPVSTEKDWRCEDCLITNKPTIEKCAACGGAKPGTKPAAKTLPSFASTNIFKDANNKMTDIIQAQKSYWECTVCLASNANDKLACMCCDAERYPQDNVQPKFTNFKFNADSNTSFKFGIDPKDQETSLANKIVETPKPKNTEESETNNNIVPKIPSFTFTLPAKKPNDKVDGSKVIEEAKPSFSFGIPKQNATPIVSSFVPISAPIAKPPDIVKPAEDDDKQQEVPSITFKAPEVTTPSSGLFSSRVPTANPQNAMNVFLNNSETKLTSPNKSLVQPSAPLEAQKLQFSFSANTAKPAVLSTGGLFTAPAPTAVSNSLAAPVVPASTLATGLFSKPEATANPSVSFFSKPDTAPAPSTTLFQNSNPAPASTTPAPMFSFGNVQNANPAPAIETKGFNFSFGSSSTASAFGTAPQANTSTFGLPAANPLTNGPTNLLGGNISANPLAQSITGNPLGGTGGNGLTASGNEMIDSSSAPMFSAPPKENTGMWPSTTEQTNQANPFMASTPKQTFLFGATSAPSPFGAQASNTQPHVFGSAQPAQNMFGMGQSNASMFASPAASQPTPMFGSAQAAAPAQPMGMFGAPPATQFSSSSTAMSTSDAPAFSFGAPQPTPGVFGFGQQPQQQMQQQTGMQQMQQAGMYSFGAAPSPAAGQVQFTMGSGSSVSSGRRVRKAVRKHPR